MVTGGEPGDPVDEPGEITTEDIGDEFRESALGYIDTNAIEPMKVMLDGGNGMAGPDGRPDPRRLPARPGAVLLGAERRASRTTSRTR